MPQLATLNWYWTQNVSDAGVNGTLISPGDSSDAYMVTVITQAINQRGLSFVVTNSTLGYYWCEIGNVSNVSLRPTTITPVCSAGSSQLMNCTDTEIANKHIHTAMCAVINSPFSPSLLLTPCFTQVVTIASNELFITTAAISSTFAETVVTIDPSTLSPSVTAVTIDPSTLSPSVTAVIIDPSTLSPSVTAVTIDPSTSSPSVTAVTIDPSTLSPHVTIDPSTLSPHVTIDPSTLSPSVTAVTIDLASTSSPSVTAVTN